MQHQSLVTLDDQTVIGDLKKLVGHDLRTQAEILRYLIEVDKRRLFLDQGYSSLWMFCHRGLGCSESMAQRRVMAVRACVIAAQALEMVAGGSISLCVLAQIAKDLTPENSSELLAQVAGKSLREVEKILAGLHPTPTKRDVVRTIVVPETPVVQVEVAAKAEVTSCAGSKIQETTNPPVCPPVKPTPRQVHRISFTASAQTMRNIERLRELLGAQELDQVIRQASEALLERCDPLRREARRQRKHHRIADKKQTTKVPVRGGSIQKRAVPQALRDEVFKRDGAACTWVSPDGVRCGVTRHVEVDHIRPWALGGKHEAENLRVLCKAHNLRRAEQTFSNSSPAEVP